VISVVGFVDERQVPERAVARTSNTVIAWRPSATPTIKPQPLATGFVVKVTL